MIAQLNTAYKSLVDILNSPYQKAVEAGRVVGEKVFPQSQRTTVVSSIVANESGASTLGYRPQNKDALTLGEAYKSWWQTKYAQGQKFWDNVRGKYMGIKISELASKPINTLRSSVEVALQKSFNTLPEIIMNKLGMEYRAWDGETVGNTPVRAHDAVYYPQYSTGVKRVPTVEIDKSYAEQMSPSGQEKGTYNIGYDDYAPITSNPISNPSVDEAKLEVGTGMPAPITFLLLLIGGWFVFKAIRR